MENQTKQQTTNLNTKSNRIFAVDCGYFYGFCKIVEFEIVKETPNQIVAAPIDKSTPFSTSERTIKKSTMECCGLKFARTYEEAVKTQINFIKNKISINETRITNLTNQNKELNEKLNQIEEDLNNE